MKMKTFKVFLACAVLGMSVCLGGCGDSGDENKANAKPIAKPIAKPVVKPMEDYRKQAAKSITKDNVQDELDKLEKEIEADKE